MKILIIHINYCSECRFSRQEYENIFCDLSGEKLSNEHDWYSSALSVPIPDSCPLEDALEEKEEQK